VDRFSREKRKLKRDLTGTKQADKQIKKERDLTKELCRGTRMWASKGKFPEVTGKSSRKKEGEKPKMRRLKMRETDVIRLRKKTQKKRKIDAFHGNRLGRGRRKRVWEGDERGWPT